MADKLFRDFVTDSTAGTPDSSDPISYGDVSAGDSKKTTPALLAASIYAAAPLDANSIVAHQVLAYY